jgi:hypothetical protein
LKILTFSLFNTEKSPAKSRGLCLQSEAAISKDSRFNCRQKYFYNLIFQKQKPKKKQYY